MSERRSHGQLRRIRVTDRREVSCVVDGRPVNGIEDDTVLTLLLSYRRHIRRFEFANARRAGFCWMGACQDCWVSTSGVRRFAPAQPSSTLD
jgi:hypothetical protein